MPNTCDNWIRVSGEPTQLAELQASPLQLDMFDPYPSDLPDHKSSDWILEHWGTKWIVEELKVGSTVQLRPQPDGSLQTRFFSAWAPPVAFYNRLASAFPGIQVEYEYAEWGMGFVGYGKGGTKETEPTHLSYETKEELDEIKKSRVWQIDVFNPHF